MKGVIKMKRSRYHITFKLRDKIRTRSIDYPPDQLDTVVERLKKIPGIQLLEVKEIVWRMI